MKETKTAFLSPTFSRRPINTPANARIFTALQTNPVVSWHANPYSLSGGHSLGWRHLGCVPLKERSPGRVNPRCKEGRATKAPEHPRRVRPLSGRRWG